MIASLAAAKSTLRNQIQIRLRNVPATVRSSASAQLCVRLARKKIFTNAKSILFFAPLPDEPDIWPLLSEALIANKIVALPRFVAEKNGYAACQIKNIETDLLRGQFGIREPRADCAEISLNRLDLVLVPGVGFDLMGRRLGRGKGFYDRLLAKISGTKCGVGFDEQLVEAIPTEPHDVHLNCILTPTRWIEVKPA